MTGHTATVRISDTSATLTYIGGPTALLEWRGLRLLTDPTFDPAGTTYEFPGYTLRKTQSPGLTADSLGRLDGVLLSHDHHADNLDHAGRSLLPRAGQVITTLEGAARLQGEVRGLAAWEETALRSDTGPALRVVATPARHGPAGADRGPVIGFALAFEDEPDRVLYISGDTVWFEGVAEVARRFDVRAAALNLGAARVRVAGPRPITLTAAEAVELAGAMPSATIVPLHYEGWEHFTENRVDVERVFHEAGLESRLRWPRPGEALVLPMSGRPRRARDFG